MGLAQATSHEEGDNGVGKGVFTIICSFQDPQGLRTNPPWTWGSYCSLKIIAVEWGMISFLVVMIGQDLCLHSDVESSINAKNIVSRSMGG